MQRIQPTQKLPQARVTKKVQRFPIMRKPVQITMMLCHTDVTEFYLGNETNINSTTENFEDCFKTEEAL